MLAFPARGPGGLGLVGFRAPAEGKTRLDVSGMLAFPACGPGGLGLIGFCTPAEGKTRLDVSGMLVSPARGPGGLGLVGFPPGEYAMRPYVPPAARRGPCR